MDGVGCVRRLVGVRRGVHGEGLVVAERVDGSVGEEACVVDGAVVDHLDQSVVLVCDLRVVDIDQPVCTS